MTTMKIYRVGEMTLTLPQFKGTDEMDATKIINHVCAHSLTRYGAVTGSKKGYRVILMDTNAGTLNRVANSIMDEWERRYQTNG